MSSVVERLRRLWEEYSDPYLAVWAYDNKRRALLHPLVDDDDCAMPRILAVLEAVGDWVDVWDSDEPLLDYEPHNDDRAYGITDKHNDALEALRAAWAELGRGRRVQDAETKSRHWPPCPGCHSPTGHEPGCALAQGR